MKHWQYKNKEAKQQLQMCKYYLFAFVLMFVLSFQMHAQELEVSNGGFENGETDWTIQAGGTSVAVYSIDNTGPYEGANSLKAEVTALGNNYWDIQFMNLSFAVEEGVSYRASIKAKASTKGMTMNYAIGKATSGYNEYVGLRDEPLTTEWKEYTVSFVSTVTTDNDIRVVVNLLSAGTYWFDDFTITRSSVSDATVNTAGNLVEIEMISSLLDPSKEKDITFFVKNSEAKYKQIEEISLVGTNNNFVRLKLLDKIYRDENITVMYFPGTVAKQTGDEIEAFTVEAQNNSTQTIIDVDEHYLFKSGAGVFPNPFQDVIHIKNDESKISSIEISDLTGKSISVVQLSGNADHTINLGFLKSGSYILKIVGNAGQLVSVHKIIKK